LKKKEKNFIPYSSLLRKFNVYFIFASLIPFLILFYFYLQKVLYERIEIKDFHFFLLLWGVGILSLVLFLIIRNTVFKVVKLTQELKSSLERKTIDRETILRLEKGEGEVADLAKVFGDVFSRLEENIKELERTKQKLYSVVTRVGKTLTSIEDFDALISLILETTVEALETEKGAIFSGEEEKFELKAEIGWKVSGDEIQKSLGHFLEWIKKERRMLSLPLLEETKDKRGIPYPVLCYPLISRDKFWGVMILCGRKEGRNFTDDELKIAANLSSQIAIAFENFKLNQDIEKTYFETMAALALAVEARDPYSRGHSERVGKYAAKIAKELGLSEEETKILQDAARLHDIGKIGVEDRILRKEGFLSPEERKIMCKHPMVGENILKPLKSFRRLLDPIRHHHEFLDGSGYPDGLKEAQIPLITRILTVADIFDALTTSRPYRDALSYEEAKRILESYTEEGKIDKKVVEALFKLMDKKEL